MILNKLSKFGVKVVLFLCVALISYSGYNIIIAFNIQKEKSISEGTSQPSENNIESINKVDSLMLKSTYSLAFVVLALVIFVVVFVYLIKNYERKFFHKQDHITFHGEDNAYRQLFNNAIMPMAIHQDGKIIQINKSGLDFLEVNSLEEIKNIDITNFIHPDYLEKALVRIAEVYDGVVRNKPYSIKLVTFKGIIKMAELSAIKIEINNAIATQITLNDISEQTKYLEELKISEEYLNNIVKKIPFPLIIYSNSKDITFINDTLKKDFGFTQEDLPTIDFWWQKTISDDKYRQETRENWEKAISSSKNNDSVVELSWVIETKNSEKRSCEFFIIKIGDDNMVIINDTTETILLSQDLLTAKEKAEESNKLKSAFLANLSHEVRTPMNGIMGFAQLLADPDLSDEERQTYVDIITKSGNRLMNMINDIISISKIDANQVELDISEFNLFSVVEEIVEFHALEAGNKGIKLIFENNIGSKDISIESDEGKLKQILSNLIGNAIKYTSIGSVKVTVLENGNYIDIQIVDTGFGIKAEKLDSIFDRFVRLDETLDKTEGSGLGLSISLAYAKRIKCEIKVESIFGKGSTFTLSVPFDIKHKKPAKVIPVLNSKRESLDLTGKSILIAEDEEFNFMILKLFLEETNANISRAVNGAIAVEMVINSPFDFVFMDIKMPIMNGFEAMKIIKSKFPQMPVVAQTAYTFSEDREKALQEGFDDYICKPLSRDKIMEILRKFFV